MKKLKSIILLIMFSYVQLSALQDSIKQNDLSRGYYLFQNSVSHLTGDSVRQIQSNIDSAIHYMKLAYPELKKEKEYEKYVECFSALTYFYHTNNDFESFKEFAEIAFEEAEKYLDPNNVKYGDIFNNLNSIYSRIGNNRKGVDLLNKSLEIRKKNENNFQLGIAYQNLGTVYSRLGEEKKAIEYLTYSFKLRTEADSLPEYDVQFAESHCILANAYSLAKDFKNSIQSYKKCLSILDDGRCQKNQLSQNLRMISLTEISENLIKEKQYKEAETYLKKAFIFHDQGIQNLHPISLYLRSLLNYERGDMTNALNDVKQANAIAGKNKNEDSPPLFARRYKLWGDILQHQGNIDSALLYYDKGLSVLTGLKIDEHKKDIDFTSILAKPEALRLLLGKSKCLSFRAEIDNTKESWLNSFNAYLDAVKLIRAMRSGIVTSESKNVLAERSMEIYEQALGAAYKILEFGPDDSVLEDVFEIIESNKALLLLESYNQHLALGSLDVPQEMLDLEYDLQVDLAYYAKESALEKRNEELDEEAIRELEQKYQVKSQQYDSLIHVINGLSPDFNKYRSQIAPVELAKLKGNLYNTNSTILEYFLGENNLYLLIIGSKRIDFLKLSKDNLLSKVEELKSQLSFEGSMTSGNDGFDRFRNASSQLYSQLFRPALPFIESNASNIIIVPDGFISSIPFDVLVSGENENAVPSYSSDYLDYIIEAYNISYSYSSTLFSKELASKNQSSTKDLIAFAPIFDKNDTSQERICECEGIQLQKLECNSVESESVSKLFSGDLYLSQSAIKEAFLNDAKAYKIIHIASHACIDQEDGMLNQIFFTDGGLSNYEIYNSKLNAELTVLSACNTGIGKIQNGEGVLNLAKGFLMAGSKSALMSLWSVNDCTTSSLMEKFYTNLKKGLPRNESMRQAKIEFLQSASKLNAHPYYWGAFVHYGKDKPLHSTSFNSKFYWGLLLVLVLSLVVFFFWRNSKK